MKDGGCVTVKDGGSCVEDSRLWASGCRVVQGRGGWWIVDRSWTLEEWITEEDEGW